MTTPKSETLRETKRVIAPQRVVRHANKFAAEFEKHGAEKWLRSIIRDAYLTGWQDAASGVEFDAMGGPLPKEPTK